MPVYNREQFIAEAFDSILKLKKPKNYEIVVVDGGSTDKTSAICRSYVKKYPRIKYYRDKQNYGFLDGFKKCIRYATGEYIFFLPSDDILLIDDFTPLLKIMDRDKKIGVLGTNLRLFTTDLVNYSKNQIFVDKNVRYKAGYDALVNWLLHSSLASVGGTIFRTNQAQKYINKLGFANFFPMIHLAILILDHCDAYHYNIISFAQRQTNQGNQLANKQYYSLDVFHEIMSLIDLIPVDKKTIDKLKKQTIANLYPSLISVRCYANSKIFFSFLKFLLQNNIQIILEIRFWIYLTLSIIVPKKLLFRFLLHYRDNKKKFEKMFATISNGWKTL
jgi:glycosyltransferase involved in cell wall biosynthesis